MKRREGIEEGEQEDGKEEEGEEKREQDEGEEKEKGEKKMKKTTTTRCFHVDISGSMRCHQGQTHIIARTHAVYARR